MAAFGGERWLHELPNHNIFTKLREVLHSEPKANVKRAAKNLTFCLDCDLFVWNDVDRVFYTTNLRQLNSDEDESCGRGNFQTLMCINPPRFEVCQVQIR